MNIPYNFFIMQFYRVLGYYCIYWIHLKIIIIITSNMQMKCEQWTLETLLFGRCIMQNSSTKMFPPYWKQNNFFAFDKIENDASIARNQQNRSRHWDSVFHDTAEVIRFVSVHLVYVLTLSFEWRYWCQGTWWCELHTGWCIIMSKSRSSNEVYDDYINIF